VLLAQGYVAAPRNDMINHKSSEYHGVRDSNKLVAVSPLTEIVLLLSSTVLRQGLQSVGVAAQAIHMHHHRPPTASTVI
jgi:hypothetical protein